MAKERTAAPMSGFFKFTKVGQSVAGMLDQHRQGAEEGRYFVVFRPVLICDGNHKGDAPLYERWESGAVGLSTDLAIKIGANDRGRFMRLTFTGLDDSTRRKGNSKKVFLVEDLEATEIRELNEQAGQSHGNEPYFPVQPVGVGADSAGADDSDDLPF